MTSTAAHFRAFLGTFPPINVLKHSIIATNNALTQNNGVIFVHRSRNRSGFYFFFLYLQIVRSFNVTIFNNPTGLNIQFTIEG